VPETRFDASPEATPNLRRNVTSQSSASSQNSSISKQFGRHYITKELGPDAEAAQLKDIDIGIQS
jgi:hypothetical protein